MKHLIALVLIFTVGFYAKSYAQDTTAQATDTSKLYLVKKTDGGEFYGHILADDGREILLLTKKIGKIYISKSDIAEIVLLTTEEVQKLRDAPYQDYRNSGPYTTRYYFTTNALPIKKNEHYAMLHLYGPEVHFAVADGFSVGVMTTWIGSPIAAAAKYTLFSKNKNSMSVGTIIGSSGFLFNGKGFGGLHFATYTRGVPGKNMSISAGYGHVSNHFLNPPENLEYDVIIPDNANPTDYYDLRLQILQQFDPRYDAPILERPSTGQGPVIGFGGIVPVGKKASFILDCMTIITPSYDWVKQRSLTVNDVTYTRWDRVNSEIVHSEVTADFNVDQYAWESSGYRWATILMPAMRFSNSHTKSFQIALAGIIQKSGTYPVPMVSWLRQF